jgi:hypothetical protein
MQQSFTNDADGKTTVVTSFPNRWCEECGLLVTDGLSVSLWTQERVWVQQLVM